MEIKVRPTGYTMREVKFISGTVTVELGLLHGEEVTNLANALRIAAREMDDVATVTRESAEDAIKFLREGHGDYGDEALDMLVGAP